jgi:kynurenine formamidase
MSAPLLPSEADVLGYLSSLSNWGRWGPGDERGTLNLITRRITQQALRLAADGLPVSCARELTPAAEPADAFGPPHRFMVMTGEGLADEHRVGGSVTGFGDGGSRVHGASEYLGMVFHGFTVTHLDALSHVFWDGQMYGAAPPAHVNALHGATSNAVTAAADGIVTRGVLLDVAALKGLRWLEPGTGVTPADLEAAETAQGIRIAEGDAVLLRTGYGRRRREVGPDDVRSDGQAGWHAACLPWLHERRAALIGCDAGCDVVPSGYPELVMPVHVVGIVAMGLWLIDNLDLEQASETARRLGRWEFLFITAPLKLAGGTGSPVNPLAVF